MWTDYADFDPTTLACEKLAERHGHCLSAETLRLPASAAHFLACYRLSLGARILRAGDGISLVTTHSECQARHGLGLRGECTRLTIRARLTVACWRDKPIGTRQVKFSKLYTFMANGILPHAKYRPSVDIRSASPVTLAPRLLSYLRINQPVTGLTARLDTGPVANGYPGGISTR